jgi:hypothetical protein
MYSLQYHKYKGKLGVSPRDFTVIVKRVFELEGECFLIGTSFVSEKHPRANKIERADLVVTQSINSVWRFRVE